MSPPSTRDRLVTAMSKSLRTRGYGATSMKELLASTGASSGSMYHSFPGGKEQLAAAAIREIGLDAAAQIRQVFAQTSDAAEGVDRIFAALARDQAATDYRFGCPIGVPATEAAAVSSEIQAASQDVFDAWIEAYRDALIGDGWQQDAAADAALTVVTNYEGSVTMSRALRSQAPITTVAARLVADIRAGTRDSVASIDDD